jgi:hypothetical protein
MILWMLNRYFLQLALYMRLTAVITMEPPLEVHLFKTYDEGVYFAWHPIHAGCTIYDASRDVDREWIKEFYEDLSRYE